MCLKVFYTILGKNNFIFKRQFSFRAGYSSNHTIANLTESIKNYIDNDNYVCSAFIYLAFQCIYKTF